MTSSRATLLLALATTAVGCAGEDAAPTLSDQIDQVFSTEIAVDGPGCALGVGQGGTTAFARGYGLANLDHGIPISPQTVFDVGSVTKQFTAASTVLLALDGALSLDDDVSDHLPELPQHDTPIRVRDLLHHTSGVRDYLNLMALGGRDFYAPIRHQDIVELLARQRALVDPPGSRYRYSNTGYMLAATIVERVSGQRFDHFAEARIFEPLGMTASVLYEDAEQVVPNRATGYAPAGGDDTGFRMVHNFPFATAGDGQLYTTVEDLLAWSEAFLADEVAGPELTTEMLTPGTLADGSRTEYGGGIVLGSYRGVTTQSHGGSTWGFRAHLLRVPDAATTVAVLCNREDLNPRRFAYQVLDLVLADRLDPAEPTAPRQPRPRSDPEPAAEVELVAGDFDGSFYSEELDARYHLALVDGKLQVRIERWPPLALEPLGDDRFRGVDFPAWTGPRQVELVFQRTARGAVIGFSLSAGTAQGLEFVRVAE